MNSDEFIGYLQIFHRSIGADARKYPAKLEQVVAYVRPSVKENRYKVRSKLKCPVKCSSPPPSSLWRKGISKRGEHMRSLMPRISAACHQVIF